MASKRSVAFVAVVIGATLVASGFLAASLFKSSRRHSTPRVVTSLPIYRTRGVIEQLPDAKGNMLMVHHERIKEWRDREGKPVGMNEMVMPFPLAPGVTLDGFVVGDPVEIEFDWSWSRQPPQTLVLIRRSPVEPSISRE